MKKSVSFSNDTTHAANGDANGDAAGSDGHHNGHGHGHRKPSNNFWRAVHLAQTYSLPLLLGIVGALLWCNLGPTSGPGSYHHFFHELMVFGSVSAAPCNPRQ